MRFGSSDIRSSASAFESLPAATRSPRPRSLYAGLRLFSTASRPFSSMRRPSSSRGGRWLAMLCFTSSNPRPSRSSTALRQLVHVGLRYISSVLGIASSLTLTNSLLTNPPGVAILRRLGCGRGRILGRQLRDQSLHLRRTAPAALPHRRGGAVGDLGERVRSLADGALDRAVLDVVAPADRLQPADRRVQRLVFVLSHSGRP